MYIAKEHVLVVVRAPALSHGYRWIWPVTAVLNLRERPGFVDQLGPHRHAVLGRAPVDLEVIEPSE